MITSQDSRDLSVVRVYQVMYALSHRLTGNTRAPEERTRKNQITYQARKETGKLDCATLSRPDPGLVRLH